MTDLRERLIDCFAAVLSRVPRDQVPQSEMNSVEQWDSITTVNLVAVIQEEFQVEVEPEDFERFTSFKNILDFLDKKSRLS
jgi:acyl carrier protein